MMCFGLGPVLLSAVLIKIGMDSDIHHLHSSRIDALAVSTSGKMLASAECGSADVSLSLLSNRRIKTVLKGPKEARPGVSAIAFSMDDNNLAVAYFDHGFAIWQLTESPKYRWYKMPGRVISLCYSANGKNLATSIGPMSAIWDANKGELVQTYFGKPSDHVWSLAFSKDSKKMAMGFTKRVAVWDIERERELWNWPAHETQISALLFLGDANTLVTGSHDGKVIFWNLKNKKRVSVSAGDGYLVSGLAYLEGVQLVVASTHGGSVLLFDPNSMKLTKKVNTGLAINALAVDQKRGDLILGFGDFTKDPLHEVNRGKIRILNSNRL